MALKMTLLAPKPATAPLAPPASWPKGLLFLHPANAFTASTQSDSDAHGNVWYALVIGPPGGIDTQYIQIVKFTPQNAVIPIQTFYARESRAWLLAHGADPKLTNGKFGNVSIDIAGSDIVLGIEMRINNVNTTIPFRLPGLAT